MQFEALSPKVRKALIAIVAKYGWVLDPECKDLMTEETQAIKLLLEVIRSVHNEVLNIVSLAEMTMTHAKGFEAAVMATAEGRELISRLTAQKIDPALSEFLEKRMRYDA
jgi:hypothetical protein